MEFQHKLGAKAFDWVTGLRGVITARAEHLHGCNRYWIQPPVDKDGKVIEGYWFDEAQIRIEEEPKAERVESNRGGPMGRVL